MGGEDRVVGVAGEEDHGAGALGCHLGDQRIGRVQDRRAGGRHDIDDASA